MGEKAKKPKELKQLIWLEVTTTGPHSDTDHLTGIAIIVTDPQLNVIAEEKQWYFIPGNTAQYKKVEEEILTFLRQHTKKRHSPLCGNQPCVARRFLYRHMPALEQFFYYRHLEMFTVRDLATRWAPRLSPPVPMAPNGALLSQLRQAITDLKYYQQHLFISV